MDFATFEQTPTSVNLFGVGVLNGYKLTTVLYGGRRVSLKRNNYFYVPHTNEVVTYKANVAMPTTINPQNKYNFQEKLEPRGVVPFKVCAHELHLAAIRAFR